MQQYEYPIHKAMIDYLDGRVWKGNKIIHRGNPAFENLLFFHIPNQGHGENAASEGFFLKQLGVVAGAYDLLFFWPPRMAGAYDAKAPGGSLKTPQKRFREQWERCGFPSAWGTSTEHLRDTLIGWGAKCMNHSVKRVDLRSWEEKCQDAFNLYAPRKDIP